MKNTNIIFLLGPSQAGKDTIGKLLVDKHEYIRVSFADAVKEEYASINNIDVKLLHIQGEEKEKHREGLIELAEGKRSIDPLCWLEKAFSPFQDENKYFNEGLNLVVTDCRRASEIDWIDNYKDLISSVNNYVKSTDSPGFYLNIFLVYIDNQKALKNDKDVLTHYCIGYAKGKELIDLTLDNNSTLEDLTQRIEKLNKLINSTIYSK